MKKIMIIGWRIFKYRLRPVPGTSGAHEWSSKKTGMSYSAPVVHQTFDKAKVNARDFFTKELKSKNEL